MNTLTTLERAIIPRERGGWGPGGPFPANRGEVPHELEWERLPRRSEAQPVVVRGPRHPAPGVRAGRSTDMPFMNDPHWRRALSINPRQEPARKSSGTRYCRTSTAISKR